MRFKGGLFFLGLLSVCASAVSAEATMASQPAQSATWRPYNLTLDLYHLPVRYSCDDLSDKFHDVLLALGAAPDIKVMAYRCEQGSNDEDGRSPRVQLKFSMPELAAPAQSYAAQLQTSTTTVRLGPGHPASLLSTDCELLRQMKAALVEHLSRRIIDYKLACDAPGFGRWPFDITVQTLMPSPAASGVVAQASARPTVKPSP
jgi:hypothetical protein